ncbi:MAG: cytochrome c3 family protein [Nitrospirota bacterium]
MKRKILSVLFVSFSILGIIVYNFHAEAQKTGGTALKGQVADASGQAIAKASVYLIPASDIEAMAKTKIEIKRDSKNDEPLEDSLAANRDKYTKAITDAKGNFTIAKIADGKYFVYAEPSDKNYLPGGDKSNKSMDASELRGKTIKILISGNPPLNAAYVGTSKCLLCHKAYETEKKTLHKLGIRAAGKDSKLQDSSDFIKSKKYRNGNQILSCADCHNPHGMTGFKHQMRADVRDEKNSLCTTCHKENSDIKKHMQTKIGFAEIDKINCIDCHAGKTMQTGAGFGKGLTGKDGKNYWMNDITSHIFDVPRKDNIGVKGVEPGKAMPIPYTNKCGMCHKADGL